MNRYAAFCFAAIAVLYAGGAGAFCVYNRVAPDEPLREQIDLQRKAYPKLLDIWAKIVTGGTYESATMKPGESHCCNWKERSCNYGGTQDAILRMQIDYDTGQQSGRVFGKEVWKQACTIDVKAGGWIDVVPSRKWAPLVCHAYDAAGKLTSSTEQAADAIATNRKRQSIVGKGSKLCLDVGGWQDKNGASVITWDCHGGLNQKWQFTKEGEIRGYGDRCLDVSGASTANGAKVHMWDCNGGNQQKWRLDGEQIVGVGSNRCLDVWAQQTTRGAGLQIYDCTGRDNQKWSKRNE